METKRRIAAVAVTALLTVGMTLNFSGCSKESTMGPTIDKEGSSQVISLAKKENKSRVVTDYGLVCERWLEPGSDGKDKADRFKLVSTEYHNMEISVKFKYPNITESTKFVLERMGEMSNTFQLTPAGISAHSISIELGYDESMLPKGISEDKLQIFADNNDQAIALSENSVAKEDGKIKISASANQTGTFFLGFYSQNILFRLEGEIDRFVIKKFKRNDDGKMDLGNGTELIVPKGALKKDTEIWMAAKMEFAEDGSVRKYFEFGPHGLVFNKPAQLKLSYKELGKSMVDLLWLNEETGQWQFSFEGQLDKDGKNVFINVNHFSRYALAHSE